MISESTLRSLYVSRRFSVPAIARRLGCSQGKINYWLARYSIPKRSISDALYTKWNPSGDPFAVKPIRTPAEAMLYGIGIGLYWGEGTKSNKTSVRLGNSDPRLIRAFTKFLVCCYGIDASRLRFGLQIFSDMDPVRERRFWARSLGVSLAQFHQKTIVIPYRGVGNYRHKTQHGVVTVYFNNRKLRDIICRAIDEASVACS